MELKYHAHIYWTTDSERSLALSFREYLHDNGCALGRIRDEPVGPHPLPMYQVTYRSSNREQVENYLKKEHHGLSVLLHENSSDNPLRDHTDGARWIGKRLKLKLEIFKNS